MDDGSTDETLSIAKKYSSGSFKVISQQKQGAAVARNHAIALSQGDYIQWLDADDVLAPDKIANQLRLFEFSATKRTLLSGAWGSFYYRTSAAKFRPSPLWCDLSPVEWLVRRWEHNAHMQTATWLVSRDLTEAAGPWDPRLLSNDDGEYFCRVIKSSDGIKFVPGTKVYYRVTGSSRLSHVGQSKDKLQAFLLGVELQMQHLLSLENSERTRRVCIQKLQTGFIRFYPEQMDLVRQTEEIAASLGTKLRKPKLSWKYVWIQKLFGWTAAKNFRTWSRRCRSNTVRICDRAILVVAQAIKG